MKLCNGNVKLRVFQEADIPYKIKWINDPQNNEYLHYNLPLNLEETKRWFCNKDDSIRLDLTIWYDNIPVGVIGLLAIDRKNQKAEYYITVGNTSLKRKGIARTASKLLLQYAFEEMKLHKVYLNVDAENIAAVRLYEKVGFQREGYFAQDLYSERKQRYIDRCRYAILSETWYGTITSGEM